MTDGSDHNRNEPNEPTEYAYAVGTNVYFRYLTENDAAGDWHLWFNAPDITRNLIAQRLPNPPERQLRYLETVNAGGDRLCLAIVERISHRLIGVGSLSKIDSVNRKAEMSCVIGDRRLMQGVHAIESLALLTEIGLVRLNLNKLIATGMDNNQPGLEMTKLLGYTVSGRFREHGFIDGVYRDCVILEILQREWLDSPRRPKTICWTPESDGA